MSVENRMLAKMNAPHSTTSSSSSGSSVQYTQAHHVALSGATSSGVPIQAHSVPLPDSPTGISDELDSLTLFGESMGVEPPAVVDQHLAVRAHQMEPVLSDDGQTRHTITMVCCMCFEVERTAGRPQSELTSGRPQSEMTSGQSLN